MTLSLLPICDLSKIAVDSDGFYKVFGKNLKLGIHEDAQNRRKLAEFLR
jgi:molecular chaperone HtpG